MRRHTVVVPEGITINRPPRPKFNSKHTMIEVDGKWHDIPDKFYGRLMDDATVDQIVSEIRSNAGGCCG